MDYIKLARPKHYIKNLLIFLPLIFSGQLFNLNLFLKVLISFISFCLIASSIYIINDIFDREKDRQHKTKCNRPQQYHTTSTGESRDSEFFDAATQDAEYFVYLSLHFISCSSSLINNFLHLFICHITTQKINRVEMFTQIYHFIV